MRRRHHLAHHTWGIVRGLTLSVDPQDQDWDFANSRLTQ
jgi:hypothetical protein